MTGSMWNVALYIVCVLTPTSLELYIDVLAGVVGLHSCVKCCVHDLVIVTYLTVQSIPLRDIQPLQFHLLTFHLPPNLSAFA